jgi:hypothetical protein
MKNTIRLSVAAAGMFVILPAWADGASVGDRQDAQQAELRGENPALPQHVASAPAPGAQAGEGAGGGEPATETQEGTGSGASKPATETQEGTGSGGSKPATGESPPRQRRPVARPCPCRPACPSSPRTWSRTGGWC